MSKKYPRLHVTRNYVIDLETLALGSNAVVTSAALAQFGGATFGPPVLIQTWVIGPIAQQRDGRALDADMVLWWLRQSDAARMAVASDEAQFRAVHPRMFLCELVETLAPKVNEGRDLSFTLWAKPMHFDLAILEHMAEQYKAPARESVFHRRRMHDVRSLFAAVNLARPDEMEDITESRDGGPAHDAAADALRTAEAMTRALVELQDIADLRAQQR